MTVRSFRFWTLIVGYLTWSSAVDVNAVNAAPWKEDDAFSMQQAATFDSSKVDAADLDGDGLIDVVFANSKGYNKGTLDSSQPQQAFKNTGGGAMTDITADVFGPGTTFNGRAIKLRDIDYDGDN